MILAKALNNEFSYTSILDKDKQNFTKDKIYSFSTVEHSYVDTYTKKEEVVTFYRTLNDNYEEQTMSFKSFSNRFCGIEGEARL